MVSRHFAEFEKHSHVEAVSKPQLLHEGVTVTPASEFNMLGLSCKSWGHPGQKQQWGARSGGCLRREEEEGWRIRVLVWDSLSPVGLLGTIWILKPLPSLTWGMQIPLCSPFLSLFLRAREVTRWDWDMANTSLPLSAGWCYQQLRFPGSS